MHAVYGSQNQINREGKIKVKKKTSSVHNDEVNKENSKHSSLFFLATRSTGTIRPSRRRRRRLPVIEDVVRRRGFQAAPVGPAQHAGRRARMRRARTARPDAQAVTAAWAGGGGRP